jgi:hypothetical protein
MQALAETVDFLMIPKEIEGGLNRRGTESSDPAGGQRCPFNPKERKLTRSIRNLFIVTAAAVVLMAAPAGAAWAQATAHSHDASTTHMLALNQGRKWATDEPLLAGMDRIRGWVEPQLSAAHAGKLTPAQYRELATQVQTEVAGIVANCKLEPKADTVLHLVIADIGAGTGAMAGEDAKARPAAGLVKVARAVNQYGSHFDHPGFKPIRNVH